MKKIIFIFSLLAAFVAMAEPTMKLEKQVHDFGNIREADGYAKCTFKFENDGDEPLVIVTVSADCGCTKPKFPARPINPGESGEITVTFNPAGYKGEFNKNIKVRTNLKKQKTVKLKISGVVIPKD